MPRWTLHTVWGWSLEYNGLDTVHGQETKMKSSPHPRAIRTSAMAVTYANAETYRSKIQQVLPTKGRENVLNQVRIMYLQWWRGWQCFCSLFGNRVMIGAQKDHKRNVYRYKIVSHQSYSTSAHSQVRGRNKEQTLVPKSGWCPISIINVLYDK
jgi:hypothetical protein